LSQVTSRAQLESASCLAPGFPPLLTENTSAPLATAALHRADPTKPDPPTTTTLAALDAAAEHNARPTMFSPSGKASSGGKDATGPLVFVC